MPLNKQNLVRAIIDQLVRELESYAASARSAHAEATHEQSKAENKYDTRALEASYLARGQSMQAAEIEQAIRQFEMLEERKAGPDTVIEVGALIELEGAGSPMFYFMGPGAGGVEILHEKKLVTVVTPQSPIARALLGRKRGDQFSFGTGRSKVDYVVRQIW